MSWFDSGCLKFAHSIVVVGVVRDLQFLRFLSSSHKKALKGILNFAIQCVQDHQVLVIPLFIGMHVVVSGYFSLGCSVFNHYIHSAIICIGKWTSSRGNFYTIHCNIG